MQPQQPDETGPIAPDLRPATPGGDAGPPGVGHGAPDAPAGASLAALAGADPHGVQWRVPHRVLALKLAGTAAFLLAAVVLRGSPPSAVVALAAAAVLSVLAIRDVAAPVRLAADESGVTIVSGYAGHRRLPWADIERIRVDRRRRRGPRADLVEIDTGEKLYLFGASELGAPCGEVVDALRALRAGR